MSETCTCRSMIYPMAVIHISEEEAARDLSAVLAKVSAGETVHIERAAESFAIVQVTKPARWTVDDAIKQSEARGSQVLLDDDFGNDMEEIMRFNRLPRRGEPWE
jgi:hypothetical protein